MGDKNGVFVAKRNFKFFGILNHIKKNYKKIQKNVKINYQQIKSLLENSLKQSIVMLGEVAEWLKAHA